MMQTICTVIQSYGTHRKEPSRCPRRRSRSPDTPTAQVSSIRHQSTQPCTDSHLTCAHVTSFFVR